MPGVPLACRALDTSSSVIWYSESHIHSNMVIPDHLADSDALLSRNRILGLMQCSILCLQRFNHTLATSPKV